METRTLQDIGPSPVAESDRRGRLTAVDRRRRCTKRLVRRWPDDPSGFLICNIWLVECLALGGEADRAERWLASALSYANAAWQLSETSAPRDQLPSLNQETS